MDDLPRYAAWGHQGARSGFEVLFLDRIDGGCRFEGYSAAVEDGEPWAVRYALLVDEDWTTERIEVTGHSAESHGSLVLEHDGSGHWRLDGETAGDLEGCMDVDLEASAFTNALPIHRLNLAVSQAANARAAWVRARDLRVEPLDQSYARVADEGGLERYDYSAPALDFSAQLAYDRHGLVVNYPGLSTRVI